MATKTTEMRECKPGTYIMIDGEPCKVVDMTKSKPGKHGAAKVRLEAVGIFDDKKRALLKPADATVDVPIIEKKKAQVISVSGDIAQLMDLESYETFEALVPHEFKGKLEAGREIMYWKLENRILIKQLS
jgi:translation initiation factor 5A